MRHDAGCSINFHVADLKDITSLARAAADQRAQSGEQLSQIEGFYNVVIGAGVEAAHAIFGLIASGEHQDWSALGLTKLLEHAPSIELWQHDIEHNGVVVPTLGFID